MSEPAESWFLTVFARIERGGPRWEFEDFYQTHLPRLCSMPPYLWARRYYTRPEPDAATMGHLAVYGFTRREHIRPYLGPLGDETPERVKPELEHFARLEGVSDVSVITFDQTAGAPFASLMDTDDPISVVWSPEPTGPGDDPTAMHFAKFEHPALAHFAGAGRFMSVAPVRADETPPDATLREDLWPIAKHWALW